MLIDTHCHLDFNQFDPDRDKVIAHARGQGVGYIINVAADTQGSQASIKLAEDHEFIFATAGIHPHYALEATEDDLEVVNRLVDNNQVIAIGEVGLDYYNRQNPHDSISREIKLRQRNLLSAFIDKAKRKKLPLIFHCRQAQEDLLGIIKDHAGVEFKAVVHCFSEDKKFLTACLDKGIYVSFTANITYKKADALRELVAFAPLERMFLETDAPFLAPQIKRGKRNEPAYIKFLAEEIAQIKGIEFEKVAAITTKNAREFFKF